MCVGFKIDTSLCTECERCVIACSLIQTGGVKPGDSHIRIQKQWPEVPEIYVCRFDDCNDKQCIQVCPVEAISSEDGIIRIDKETCISCEVCVEACPFSAVRMVDGYAVKCDFCGGDPACIQECATKALTRKGA
jgi:Fe-S-cluster-containing hydrogenase component 2